MANLDILRRKLEHFERELAITSNSESKFELAVRIEECKSEIEECESNINPPSSRSTPTSLEKVYVKRNYLDSYTIEQYCHQKIEEKGALLRINAPQKMGKTSLIFNIREYCQQHNMRAERLSLREFDLQNIQELESFLQCFCQEVSQTLNLPTAVNDHWRSQGIAGNKSKCTSYFEKHILNRDKFPVVLAIDDVECLAPYPDVCQEFFSMLRSWHEAKTEIIWQNLRLIISYSTEQFIELPLNDSLFNVGVNIELREFTEEEVQILASHYEVLEDRVSFEEMTDFVVASPHLMELAFSYFKNNPNYTFEEFLKFAPTQQGVYKDHLRRLLGILNRLPIGKEYKNIVTSNVPVSTDPVIGDQLGRLGLIKWEGNRAIPSCKMYRQYFSRYLK